jgi:hypothetical protein
VVIAAQSTAEATLTSIIGIAGTIDAQSTVAGTLTIGMVHQLVGLIAARAGAEAYLTGGTHPTAIGPVRLVAPNGLHEIRRVPFEWIRKGQQYTEALQVVADDGHPNPVLWTDRPWLEVSVDGGAYQAVGITRAQGVSLGTLSPGVYLDLTLRVTVPATESVRTETLALNIGGGV